MGFLIFLLVFYVLVSLSLYKVFEKAGVSPTKALIPGINFAEWCKLIGQKPTHALWLLFPIVNIFIFAGMAVDLMRSFGNYGFKESALAVVLNPVANWWLGTSKDQQYVGPTLIAEKEYEEKLATAFESDNKREYKKLQFNNPYKKTQTREWAEAIIFAVFAAAFIRMFLIEAYVIPTSSMEGSLNVGDYLFVSKAHYGMRTPKTIAMFPLLHNRIPFINKESYLKTPSLDFHRLPAIETIDRNDPVVFNYPEGDSVYVFPERTYSIHDYNRGAISQRRGQQIKTGNADLAVRPIDKKDHYIKRCVAIAGDTIQIKDRQLFINGQPAENPTNIQFSYLVTFPNGLNINRFSEWNISPEDTGDYGNGQMAGNNPLGENHRVLVLNEAQKEKLKALDKNIQIIPNRKYLIKNLDTKQASLQAAGIGQEYFRYATSQTSAYFTLTPELLNKLYEVDSTVVARPQNDSERLFPHDPVNFKHHRSVDDFGPVWIPKKGATVSLTAKNLPLYKRIISVYEENDLKVAGGKITINGKETNEYTFKQDYYWMMGDNRHNSEDSRVWGFVPFDHVVGKPLFIWFSTKEGSMFKGINWDRIFTSADKR